MGFWWSREPTWPTQGQRCGRRHSRSPRPASAAVRSRRGQRADRPGLPESDRCARQARGSGSRSPTRTAGVRLWLDRVFAIKGIGTVVTGTLQAGTVRHRGRADADSRLRAAPGQGPAVARLTGRPGQRRRPGGAEPAGRQHRGTEPRHGARRRRPLDGDQRDRRPPGPAPARFRRPSGAVQPAARAHGAHRRGTCRGPGPDARRAGFARLSLDHALPLHVGDRVLLRDPGAAPDHSGERPVFGATVLDVSPPPRRAATAPPQPRSGNWPSWPEMPRTSDLLRRHRLLRASTASAMGLADLPPPVSGEWLADPAHWQRLGQLLAAAVAAHAARDPLAPGLPGRSGPDRAGLARPRSGRGPRGRAPAGRRPRARSRRAADICAPPAAVKATDTCAPPAAERDACRRRPGGADSG